VQRRSLLEGYPGPDALSCFLRNLSKNSDNLIETNRTSERFFDGSSISRKVKTTACEGLGTTVRSKLLVLTPPRLWHEDLRTHSESPGLRPTSFQEAFEQPHGLRSKKAISQVLTVYFGTPSMFITLWFGFDYGTNPPLATLII
jgi:hypothetical protein